MSQLCVEFASQYDAALILSARLLTNKFYLNDNGVVKSWLKHYASRPHTFHDSETTYVEHFSRMTAIPDPEFQFAA